ncbi:MAG: hypothetical protein ACI9GW_002451 [Halieaceae bacterium]|jgi:hypothetical protein
MSDSPKSLLVPVPDKIYRVAQWATGRIGTISLREIINAQQFELVGVYVHSKDKDGKDAGELCGLPPTGVVATTDIEKIIGLKPDCIISTQEGCNLDEVCHFLEAGINIVTSRVDYLEPKRMDSEVRRRTQEACSRGNASIHATGSSPGFSSDVLPLATLAMSRSMESLTIDEFADLPASCPDVQIIDGMGFGREPGDEFNKGILDHVSQGFIQSVQVVADAIGVHLDGFEVFGETANARERFLLPGGSPIEGGTVAAQRITVSGVANGKSVIRFRLNWYCTLDIDQDWDLRGNGWHVLALGEAPVSAYISFPVEKERMSNAMGSLTAYRVLNAVPYVCAATAGIKTSMDLPFIVPKIRLA